MLLKIALNGARQKSESAYIPHSLNEIEKDVKLLFDNGAKVFHIHCYDDSGMESMKPDYVNRLVKTIKSISSDIQLGISSGEWIEPDFEKRKEQIKAWDTIPDFISVNFIEDNAVEIAELLISKGVMVEAGLNEKKAAETFAASGLISGCSRILIEPEPESFDSAIQVLNEIEEVLILNKIKLPILLHGFNAAAWDLIREAKTRGYDSRIGMEDTLFLENGTSVKSNLELLIEANKILNL